MATEKTRVMAVRPSDEDSMVLFVHDLHETLYEQAKEIIKAETHLPTIIAFKLTEGEHEASMTTLAITHVEMKNDADKARVKDLLTLGSKVGVAVFISEAWAHAAHKDDPDSKALLSGEKRVSDLANRYEVLAMKFLTKDGKQAFAFHTITREADGSGTLQPAKVEWEGGDKHFEGALVH